MRYLSNTAQIREADRIQIEEMGLPGIILMENAAKSAAERLVELYPDERFLVLAGPGNNGGDGLAMARFLHVWGKQVDVIFSHSPDRYQGDALINYQILRKLPVSVEVYSSSVLAEKAVEWPIVVDALLGTGISDQLRGTIVSIIAEVKACDLTTVAVDLPSGLSAATGQVINDVLWADHTFTFQLPKVCHYVTPASNLCGEIHCLDIGIWPEVIQRLKIKRRVLDDDFVSSYYEPRAKESHKGTYGHVLLVGGSKAMSGAIALAASAAMRMGAGLCTVLTSEACRAAVNALCPEAMCVTVSEDELGKNAVGLFEQHSKEKDAVLIGPGMGQSADTADFLSQILYNITQPLILDADALNLLASQPDWWQQVPPDSILTPHPGEMSRLCNGASIQPQRLEIAESSAKQWQQIIVLKGAGTLVACPDGTTYVNTTGNPGMASGGMGDVLAGMITALVGQGYPRGVAAAMAVYLHGATADLIASQTASEALLASDLPDKIGIILGDMLN